MSSENPDKNSASMLHGVRPPHTLVPTSITVTDSPPQHAAYVAGAAKVPYLPALSTSLSPFLPLSPTHPPPLTPHQETIGTLTSSEPWLAAGRDTKSAAVDEMRAAKDASAGAAPRNPTVGRIEETLGKGVGCEGMVDEGHKAGAVGQGEGGT